MANVQQQQSSRRITTLEATVRTASVEVKTLTLSRKQVTLSIFRQLISEPLIDHDTCQLRGVPWGTVNYFWDRCGYAYVEYSGMSREHLHVVWQKGEDLRRACVSSGWPAKGEYRYRADQTRAHHQGLVQTAWQETLKPVFLLAYDRGLRKTFPKRNEHDQLLIPVAGLVFRIERNDVRYLMRLEEYAGVIEPPSWPETYVVRERDNLFAELTGETLANEDDVEATAEVLIREAYRHFREVRDSADPSVPLFTQLEQLNTRYAEQYAALVALDQLFIAA